MATVTALNLVSVIVCVLAVTVISLDTVPIPEQKAQVESWFNANVQPLASRKGLDPALVKAEGAVQHIKVGKGGQFKTIQDAVNSVPASNTKRYIIFIAGGTYNERVKIDPKKPFITFYGDPKDRPTINAAATAAQFGTVYSATLYVVADYFQAVNIDVRNSAPQPSGKKKDEQAVAMTIAGKKAAFYNCRFYGFQDTLCDQTNQHFYKDCYIEGTVDFVFGNAKTIFLNTELRVIQRPHRHLSFIAAHGRASLKEDTGFSFVHCQVTGNGKSKIGLLGRIWQPFATAIYAYSKIDNAIQPMGWQGTSAKPRDGGTSYFGEYKNTGPGSNMAGRPKWVHKLTDAEANRYLTLGFIEGSKWLLPPSPKLLHSTFQGEPALHACMHARDKPKVVLCGTQHFKVIENDK